MTTGPSLAVRPEGPAPEGDIARDMARRALPAAPAIVAIGAVGWGWDGAISAAYALVLVLANLGLSAALLVRSGRLSLAAMMGAALVGYPIRLGLVFLAVLAVKDTGWFEPWPLGLTIIVAHLGLLFWETRYVSASLAFPGLRPPRPTVPSTEE